MVRKNAALIARWLHRLFEASLVVKGILAALEGLSGLGLLLTANRHLVALVDWLTRHEITQDPQREARKAGCSAMPSCLSIESQHFYALYLLSHGALKLGMVILLALASRLGLSGGHPGA